MKVYINFDKGIKEKIEQTIFYEFVIKPQRLYHLYSRVKNRVPETEERRQINKDEYMKKGKEQAIFYTAVIKPRYPFQ